VPFERSTDYELLGRLLRNPALYPFISDDFAPPIEAVEAVENPGLWYILASDERGLFGCYLFEPRSPILWEFHTVMPLNGRALTAMKALLGPSGWLWANTTCERAVTYVVESNPIALRFGLRAGLTVYGRNFKSYRKGGVLQDQILMGISKE
jgi:hypothetical protein